MLAKIPFSPDELNIIGQHISTKSMSFGGPAPMYNTPITPKENFFHALKRDGETLWIPTMSDTLTIESRVNIDHIARAEVMDMGEPLALEDKGGKDMFGIEWVFVPQVGGSMVKPGTPVLDDVNDWPEIIKFPDVEAMDWAACKELNSCMNETKRAFQVTFQNGIFERLISFMDFEGAAMAIIDEDQQDAVHALFDKLADLYIAMITKYMECVNIEGVHFHDDWGSQRSPFFSAATCSEMIVPHMKKIADFCHSKGLFFHLHSCGKNELLVPCMIEVGVDMWFPQVMNDTAMLVEKYGDKIMFGVIPKLPADPTDEQLDEAAKAFVEQYAPGFPEKPVMMVGFMTPPAFGPLVYKYSREYFAAH
ncbi:MAG: methyltransferase [Eubacterium sp.]|nr:methyltransferase [Eubacterium sp.]